MADQDTLLFPHPGSVPSTPLIWPALAHTSNQVQQTKISAVPRAANVLPTTQPSVPSVAPRTTPVPVSGVRVVTKPAVAGQKTIIVQFIHPHGDRYFQGASIYLQRKNGQPTQVASGNKSPLTFTMPVSNAPHSLFVTSIGPWGETNVLTSPSRRVKLT